MANGVAVSAYTFDTHAFVKRLTVAGLSVEAAETLADEQSHLVEKITANVASVATNAASKEELKEHKSALKEYKSDLKEDFKRLDVSLEAKFETQRKDTHHALSDLRKDIVALETRSDAKFDALRKDNEILRSDITWIKWILGVLATGIFVPLLKGMFQ